MYLGKRSLTSVANTMVVIKELRWLAAAGKCGQAAMNHRLLTSDESREVNSLQDCSMDVSVYYTINVVVAQIVE